MIDLKKISADLEREISALFAELQSGIAAREDSRAFGAMIERRIGDNWSAICSSLGHEAVPLPGRRSIFDFGFKIDGQIIGIDVKTKDLDETSYSDGGICAVGNLLKFLANDKGTFLLVEFGHNKAAAATDARDIEYIRVAPFIMLPSNCYRIENLGTGQVRLNYTVHQVWEEIAWTRDVNEFYNIFVDLAILHYKRVTRDAEKRIRALEQFRNEGFSHFTFAID